MGKNKGKGGAATNAGTVPAQVPVRGAVAPVATVQAATVVTAGQPAMPGVLQVTPGVALRGARAAWYAVLLQYNGKPVAEFLAATNATPGGTGTAPSVPKSGVAEKPQGWLGWFTRSGIAKVVPPGAAPQAPAP